MVVVWVEFDLTCRPFSTPYLTCLSNNEFCGFIRINQNSLRRLTYFSSVNEIDGSSIIWVSPLVIADSERDMPEIEPWANRLVHQCSDHWAEVRQ